MLGCTPPAQCMLGYTPCCPVHAGIWSTSGRYASNWNAFLFWYQVTSGGRKYLLYQVPSRGQLSMGRYPGGGARYAWGVGIPRVVGIPGYITKSPAVTDSYWWPPKQVVRILLECFLVISLIIVQLQRTDILASTIWTAMLDHWHNQGRVLRMRPHTSRVQFLSSHQFSVKSLPNNKEDIFCTLRLNYF